MTAAEPMEELDSARYISLTTFKRDGTPVSSPVWIAGDAGTYVVVTSDKAWKTRRLLRNSEVEAKVCDMRGRSTPSASTYRGKGEVLKSPEDLADAEKQLSDKYGWQYRLAKTLDKMRKFFRPSHPRVPSQSDSHSRLPE